MALLEMFVDVDIMLVTSLYFMNWIQQVVVIFFFIDTFVLSSCSDYVYLVRFAHTYQPLNNQNW